MPPPPTHLLAQKLIPAPGVRKLLRGTAVQLQPGQAGKATGRQLWQNAAPDWGIAIPALEMQLLMRGGAGQRAGGRHLLRGAIRCPHSNATACSIIPANRLEGGSGGRALQSLHSVPSELLSTMLYKAG